MLPIQTRTLVKSTAPVLQQHGETLTRHFYSRMFTHNPELREVFNQGHQRSGTQQQALAQAVTAYAQHIDNPAVLMPVLERVAQKHVSLGIRKEHYAVVGRHLLASIGEVLGEAATPELLNAWAEAYGQLADILTGMEQAAYDQAATQEGGWTGWRSFRLIAKQPESAEITSFEFAPADGGSLPGYRPGQYISVRLPVPELGYKQPRQYSLSDAPRRDRLRISVKREAGGDQQPQGMVSNRLHDHVQVGDLVDIAPPAGDFFLHEDSNRPVVLISAGVGITPMIAMLEHLHATQSTRPLRFWHACRHGDVQAFGARVRTLVSELPDASSWFVHEAEAGRADAVQADAFGRLDLGEQTLPDDADYYVCGPLGFMSAQIQTLKTRGIPAKRIHAEAFGTGGPGH
ncbi:MAG: hypothetical protein RLZZ369_649 [Pseudomonadota bacterium]|jgi:nitric oxide dioxygenase|uniref:NO-inducible flavohemoprotein n=1 Tax=Aquabacterium sp. TaxID=1872578 RepID=UPI001B741130|nr:NO-inducible flavohemoprotein [Aquabacterium sp.]MBP7133494.1 NO-inducible flavohemoprotein [Aquabacterium sp.]